MVGRLSRTLLLACLVSGFSGRTAAAPCASGVDDTGKNCPANDDNKPCPAGCEAPSPTAQPSLAPTLPLETPVPSVTFTPSISFAPTLAPTAPEFTVRTFKQV